MRHDADVIDVIIQSTVSTTDMPCGRNVFGARNAADKMEQ
jgi:hypothetical protein